MGCPSWSVHVERLTVTSGSSLAWAARGTMARAKSDRTGRTRRRGISEVLLEREVGDKAFRALGDRHADDRALAERVAQASAVRLVHVAQAERAPAGRHLADLGQGERPQAVPDEPAVLDVPDREVRVGEAMGGVAGAAPSAGSTLWWTARSASTRRFENTGR